MTCVAGFALSPAVQMGRNTSRPGRRSISKIRNGRDFSRDTLQKILRNLGIDVEIALHKRADGGIGTLRFLQAK